MLCYSAPVISVEECDIVWNRHDSFVPEMIVQKNIRPSLTRWQSMPQVIKAMFHHGFNFFPFYATSSRERKRSLSFQQCVPPTDFLAFGLFHFQPMNLLFFSTAVLTKWNPSNHFLPFHCTPVVYWNHQCDISELKQCNLEDKCLFVDWVWLAPTYWRLTAWQFVSHGVQKRKLSIGICKRGKKKRFLDVSICTVYAEFCT